MIERTFIEQGMKKIQLEQYLKKQLNRAGFTGLHMVKTPLVTRIVLRVAKPGLAIGKGGQNIRNLTDEIGKRFGIDNPQIEIQDIQKPELDAIATVDKMVELIERGFSWKSVVFRTVRDITEANAQGVEMVLKGKLSGKGGRKRKHRVIQGYMKKVGDQVKLVDTAKASAYPKAGAIGIKLSIIRPDVIFPDKVNIGEELDKKKAAETERLAEEKKAEKTAEEKSKASEGEAEKKGAEKTAGEKKPEEKASEKKEPEEKKSGEKAAGKKEPVEKQGKDAEKKAEKAAGKKKKAEEKTGKAKRAEGKGKAAGKKAGEEGKKKPTKEENHAKKKAAKEESK